ncbi:M20 family metallopeptidase [Gorillibacterium timonense]|uniref:M20 family metallopeptidase n=1 Tax=Gorillibacterium timonense TaxID=1689269 RepID=UPI00071D4E9E|nr:M20 family metallopeptidase [Gorillibacterium timonense]
MKTTICRAIDDCFDSLTDTALYIGRHPELGHEEVLASARLMEEFGKAGFQVEPAPLAISTAFIASYSSKKPGPVIALLCEYDALPELGHACGHHLISGMSLGAAIGLAAVLEETGGTLRVYGTPAEETMGAKVDMAAAGLFRDVDAALMAHPYHSHVKSGHSLAMDALQFTYHGKAAHAAASPHEGVNALDAVLLLFNSISMLRQQLPDHVRIHGIISDGGKAPNIIPERAEARFYLRSAHRPVTDEVVEKVRCCAEGAAMQTGCTLDISNYEYSYDELITNQTLSASFTANLLALGIEEKEVQDGKDTGSLDLGNVSRQCPTIHPYVKVTEEPYLLHTAEFRDAAMLPRALEGMRQGAKALALTAYDVLTQPELLARVKAEYLTAVSGQ